MWSLVYVCIFAYFSLALAEGTVEDDDSEQMARCKQENNATEDVEEVLNGFVPETHEGKCMLSCFLEANNLMKEGKLDRPGLGMWIKKVFPNYIDTEPIIEAFYNECFAPFIGLDKCEAASSFFGCGAKSQIVTWRRKRGLQGIQYN